jgi:hypothetical protein
MNLIIASELTGDPPSEGLYFRHLTMVAKKELFYDVVIESEKENIDIYYNFLKRKGWFDFVDDFVLPEWRIDGVRLDTELSYPMTVRTKCIRCENTPSLLGQIKSLREL